MASSSWTEAARRALRELQRRTACRTAETASEGRFFHLAEEIERDFRMLGCSCRMPAMSRPEDGGMATIEERVADLEGKMIPDCGTRCAAAFDR